MKFWNVGAEGQILVGGLATASCMILLGDKIPNVVLILLMIVITIMGKVFIAKDKKAAEKAAAAGVDAATVTFAQIKSWVAPAQIVSWVHAWQMIFMLSCLIFLYFGGILLCKIFPRPKSEFDDDEEYAD